MNITMSSTADVSVRLKCPDCDGSGRDGWLNCKRCDGRGWLYEKPLTLAERVARLERMMEK